MKAKSFLTFMILLIFSWAASAQGYAIRVTYNTNLRAAPSLDGRYVTTAKAGSVLQVLDQSNRWLRISRDGRDLWMAGWVSYNRVEASAPTQRQTTSIIDNCCFVDRQCHTDKEWADGYWAFQNGQCAAPAQTRVSTQPDAAASAAVTTPAIIDNCCYAGWQCHTDEQWSSGYEAYQKDQCASPTQSSLLPAGMDGSQVDNCCWVNRLCNSDLDWQRGHAAYKYYQCSTGIPIAIEGSPRFVREVRDAFNLLKEKVPRLYAYGISGLSKVREVPAGSIIGVYVEERTFEYASDLVKNDEESIIFLAGSILHEACHVHRWEAGFREVAWKEERACVERDLEAVMTLDPEDRYGYAAWYRDLIANLHKPEYWWWADD